MSTEFYYSFSSVTIESSVETNLLQRTLLRYYSSTSFFTLIMVRFLEPLRLISNEIVPQAASPRTLTKIKRTYGKPEIEVMILCFSSRNSSLLSSGVVSFSSLLRTPSHRMVTGNTAAQHDRGRRAIFKRNRDCKRRVEFPG